MAMEAFSHMLERSMIVVLQLRPLSTSKGSSISLPRLDISMSDGVIDTPNAESVSLGAIYVSQNG